MRARPSAMVRRCGLAGVGIGDSDADSISTPQDALGTRNAGLTLTLLWQR
jgi:hypothetical protein